MTYRTAAMSANQPQKSFRKNRNTVSYNGGLSKLGPVSNMVVVFILLSLIGLLYLSQITKTNNYSYEIDELENKYNQELKLNQSLKQDAARLRSIQRVANAANSQGLVEANEQNIKH